MYLIFLYFNILILTTSLTHFCEFPLCARWHITRYLGSKDKLDEILTEEPKSNKSTCDRRMCVGGVGEVKYGGGDA